MNNNGQPVGLHSDFVYLNNGIDDYDIQDVKDKFRLMLDNGMRRHFEPHRRALYSIPTM